MSSDVRYVPGELVRLQNWIADPEDFAHINDGCKLRTRNAYITQIGEGPFVGMKDVMVVVQVYDREGEKILADRAEVFVVANGGVGWIYFSCVEKL